MPSSPEAKDCSPVNEVLQTMREKLSVFSDLVDTSQRRRLRRFSKSFPAKDPLIYSAIEVRDELHVRLRRRRNLLSRINPVQESSKSAKPASYREGNSLDVSETTYDSSFTECTRDLTCVRIPMVVSSPSRKASISRRLRRMITQFRTGASCEATDTLQPTRNRLISTSFVEERVGI